VSENRLQKNCRSTIVEISRAHPCLSEYLGPGSPDFSLKSAQFAYWTVQVIELLALMHVVHFPPSTHRMNQNAGSGPAPSASERNKTWCAAIWFDAHHFPHSARASSANTSIVERHCTAPELAELSQLQNANLTKMGQAEYGKAKLWYRIIERSRDDTSISRALMAVVPNPPLGLNSFSALCKTGFPADSPQTSQSATKPEH